MKTFTRIKGPYSQRTSLPRVGRIRLGIKAESASGATYPKEVPHFVVTSENPYADKIRELYGPEPTSLDIWLPSDDPEKVCIQKLAWYGSSTSLKCHGDSEDALRRDEATGEWCAMKCPCEHLKTNENPKGQCAPVTHLMFLLPNITMAGTFQLSTGSALSTTALNSAFEYIKAMVGRIGMIPLTLRRVPTQVLYQGKKTTHHILSLVLEGTLEDVKALRQASPPSNNQPLRIDAPIDDLDMDSNEPEEEPKPVTSTPPYEPSAPSYERKAAPATGQATRPAVQEDRATSNATNQALSILNVLPTRLSPQEVAKLGYTKDRILGWSPAYRSSKLNELLALPLKPPTSDGGGKE